MLPDNIESHYNLQILLSNALAQLRDRAVCLMEDWSKHATFVDKCLFTPVPIRLISLESNQGWLIHWCSVVLSLCGKQNESHFNM